ncbi:hypothetical protein SBD_2616 [Streptomyces bottropensis ATCC 25435]|uniref:Uncharacterized protein n=1 Tax=Streptomyces bottropensis ATCC 25435 TaxID=1054862 RepID=M3F1D4_9ACTN|nr:hypothetical protein SBD_2616 [Streptomyces bottropensis ATCC 25435]
MKAPRGGQPVGVVDNPTMMRTPRRRRIPIFGGRHEFRTCRMRLCVRGTVTVRPQRGERAPAAL